MTALFWSLAAVMVGAAMALVLLPLLRARHAGADARRRWNLAAYRERLAALEADYAAGRLSTEDYEATREEIERAVLIDGQTAEPRRGPQRVLPSALAVSLLLPVTAVGVYLWVGHPQALTSPATPASSDSISVRDAVERLARRLREDPSDGRGWLLLARSYASLGRYHRAVAAYRRARERLGNAPQLLAELARARMWSEGGRVTARTLALAEQALENDPDNGLASWVAAKGDFQAGRREEAVARWRNLLARVPPDSAAYREVQAMLRRADAAPVTEETATPARRVAPPAREATMSIKVRVELAPDMRQRVADDDTLFVLARAPSGPRMPLAVVRKKAGALPSVVWLDDTMAMRPDRRLAPGNRVVIAARISRAGTAQPRPGDLYGETGPLELRDGDSASVEIDRMVGKKK